MKSKTKLLAGLIAVTAIMNCGVVAMAAQHTEYPWGGTWNWGKRDEGNVTYAYSDYYLTASDQYYTNGVHQTTTIGGNNDSNTSYWIESGKWATSKVPAKWWATERCFYNAQDKNGNPKA